MIMIMIMIMIMNETNDDDIYATAYANMSCVDMKQ